MISSMPDSPNVFHHPLSLNLTPRQLSMVLPSLEAFLGEHKTCVGDVLIGTETKRWTNRDMRRLEDVVIQEAASPERAVDYLRVLRKACAFWAARERTKVGYPRIPTSLHQPSNPFRASFGKLLRQYAAWKEVLDHWVKGNKTGQTSNGDPSATVEALILSSILYGGLHTRSSVVAMIRALANAPNRTLCVDGRMHIELHLSWRGVPDMEFRRWQPDALTATLWATIPESGLGDLVDLTRPNSETKDLRDVNLAKWINQRLKSRLEETSGLQKEPRGGLDQVLQAANVVAYIEMPSILAAYAGRKLISHSMKRRAFQRLSAEKVPSAENETQSADVTASTDINIPDPSILRTPEDLEPDWLRAVRTALSGETAKEICERMNQLASKTEATPFVKRLSDFLDWLVRAPTPSGAARTLSSAARTLIELARSMGPLLEVPDPFGLGAAVREDLYSRMLEGTGQLPVAALDRQMLPPASRRRRNLSRALAEFDRYLVSNGAEPVEDPSIFCNRFGLATVDANLITYEEFSRALTEVDAKWPPLKEPERNSIARILLSLGFRCGLRRLEALHCLIDDIGPAPDYEFAVRASEYRKLKSRSVRRRIPLRLFLPSSDTGENELATMIAWLQQRKSDPAASEYLFGISKEGLDVVPQAMIEDINNILRKVTGDPSVHFHHLRHSFASWTWLRLMLADLPNPPNPPEMFPHLESTSNWLREGPAFRAAVFGYSKNTRKHAYLVAQQLGHLSPATSLQTYVHFADWLLPVFLSRSERMRPSKSLILRASAIARQTAGNWGFDEEHPLVLPVRLWKLGHQDQEHEQAMAEAAPSVGDEWVWSTYNLIQDLETSSRSIEDLAAFHHCDIETARRIRQRTAELVRMRSATTAWRRTRTDSSEFEEETGIRRLVWTNDPSDRVIVEHFAGKLAGLMQSHPDVAEAGLRCFMSHVWETRPLVVFHDPDQEGDDAVNFVRFLEALAIDRKNIRWFSFISGQRSAYRKQWRTILGLNSHDHIKNLTAPNADSDAAEKWFGIRPSLEPWAGAAHSDNPGAYGFRFLMMTAYLRWNEVE